MRLSLRPIVVHSILWTTIATTMASNLVIGRDVVSQVQWRKWRVWAPIFIGAPDGETSLHSKPPCIWAFYSLSNQSIMVLGSAAFTSVKDTQGMWEKVVDSWSSLLLNLAANAGLWVAEWSIPATHDGGPAETRTTLRKTGQSPPL